MLKDFDPTREIRQRLTTAGIDFSRLTWRDTEMLVDDALMPLRDEMKRLRALVQAYHGVLVAAEKLLPYLPDRNDALNYAATNEGRASSYQVAALDLRTAANNVRNVG
jgi:hypothetical protein